MATPDFEEMLRQTLEDYRLSRGERRLLAEVLEEQGLDGRRQALLRHQAFDVAREAVHGPEGRRVLDWLEDVLKLLLPREEPEDGRERAEAHFSPGDDCPRTIANLVRYARRRIDICVFTITDDRISDAIREAHERGRHVRIITDGAKTNDMGSDIEGLAAAGVPVRSDRSEYHMHHKFAVFDERILLTGSYNWTRGAAEHNEENFVVTTDERLVAPFQQVFAELWERLGR